MNGGPCPACGAALQLVWVHSHGQCAACGVNVVPCCMGAGQEADELAAPPDGAPTVDDVLGAFAQLAGGASLLPSEPLLIELTQRHGCTWQDAEAAVERAVAVRRLQRQGKLLRAP